MTTRISIVGLAKSGTSALYSTIKACLPEPRRLMFEPKTPEELAYVAKGHAENGLVKMMYTSLSRLGYDPKTFTHSVAIVRDPRDIFVSSVLFLFNRMKLLNDKDTVEALIETFKRKEQDPRAVSIADILEMVQPGMADEFRQRFGEQLRRYAAYLDKGHHHVILFDDMRNGRFDALSAYLGLTLSAPQKLGGWIEKIGRKGDSGDWKHWFCPSDVVFFRNSMEPFLAKYGFDLDWTLEANPVIDPQHCSGYIAKLVAARRSDPNLPANQITDMAALRSAAEDGKVNALARLVELLREAGTEPALEEAAVYQETLGAMGQAKHAVAAGRHFARRGDLDRALVSLRKAVQIGGVPAAHFSLAHHLLAKADKASFDEAVLLLQQGAEMGDASCKERLESLALGR